MSGNFKCAHCGEEDDLDLNVDPADLEDGERIECFACGETSVVWCGELVDADTYHESYCDSQAAERYEDAAYGDDREYYIESSGRRDPDREDFHSDG